MRCLGKRRMEACACRLRGAHAARADVAPEQNGSELEPFSFSWYKLRNLVCIARQLARPKNAAPKTMSDFVSYLDDNTEIFETSQDYRRDN